ncbi:STAS-like domain-containing protein [Enterococcus thailandicus]|uniref:STAS-like domain-containing protein n=1 Tax=Enterococcus thailandicus TaxID=417368 RepID=UPI0022DFA83F|nr:STAS-like domain-containing protein [Enterococcus thailandicus]
MVLINIVNHLNSYYTNDDGDKLFHIIVEKINAGESVEISFEGIDSINSSFVNSAFISLLDFYTFDEIRKKVNFINTNKQINLLILNRFKFEVKKKQKIETKFTQVMV